MARIKKKHPQNTPLLARAWLIFGGFTSPKTGKKKSPYWGFSPVKGSKFAVMKKTSGI